MMTTHNRCCQMLQRSVSSVLHYFRQLLTQLCDSQMCRWASATLYMAQHPTSLNFFHFFTETVVRLLSEPWYCAPVAAFGMMPALVPRPPISQNLSAAACLPATSKMSRLCCLQKLRDKRY